MDQTSVRYRRYLRWPHFLFLLAASVSMLLPFAF
jgi:hypothetical protein